MLENIYTSFTMTGIGAGDLTVERCIQLASRQSVARNWRRCNVLIIDEISMIDCAFFDKLEKVSIDLFSLRILLIYT